MKIALILLHADPARGGAERYTLDLAAALQARGHSVSVLASSHAKSGAWRSVTIAARGFTRLGRYRSFLAHLDQHLAGAYGKYDIVHAMLPVRHCTHYHPHAGIMAEAASQRGLLGVLNLRRWYMARVERDMLSSASPPLTLCLSNYVAKGFTRHYPQARWERLFNGVDTKWFDPDRLPSAGPDFRLKLGIPSNAVLALFVGQDFDRKGLGMALDAISDLPSSDAGDVHLVVAGDEKRNPDYRTRVVNAGLQGRVHFVGNLPDTYPAYAASDLLLLPTRHDPCSLVVLEAAAMKLPVLTSDHNGAGEILKSGVTGEVLPVGDSTAWGKYLAEWINRERLRQAKAALGADRGGLDHCFHVDRLLFLYESSS